jgi:hypothetical protein
MASDCLVRGFNAMGHEHHCRPGARAELPCIDIGHTHFAPSTHPAWHVNLRGMGLRPGKTLRRRDPVNDLYDCACALLHAAHELRAAAGQPGSAPAFAATLGCIEATLSELNESVGSIRARTSAHLSSAGIGRPVAVESALAELRVLCQELEDAGRAAGAARRTVAPLLAEAGLD